MHDWPYVFGSFTQFIGKNCLANKWTEQVSCSSYAAVPFEYGNFDRQNVSAIKFFFEKVVERRLIWKFLIGDTDLILDFFDGVLGGLPVFFKEIYSAWLHHAVAIVMAKKMSSLWLYVCEGPWRKSISIFSRTTPSNRQRYWNFSGIFGLTF